MTEAKSKVAQTVDDFRGCHQYNLGDDNMRRFIAEVPQIVMWDDHEVRDNWYWERRQDNDPRYDVKSVALLAARGRQAFFEYNPLPLVGDDPERVYRSIPLGPLVDVFALDMRSYKGANSPNRQGTLDASAAILGPAQLQWLKQGLANSRATWKIVAADLPLGLVVRDGDTDYEAVANGDPGAPLGRELEVADLLRHLKTNRVRNVVWITADVHYCAAHYYDPANAKFTEFDPFWEFVAGPLNAGTFGPNTTRRDVRAGGEVHRRAARHETESSAVGRFPVFRHAHGRRAHERAHGGVAQRRWTDPCTRWNCRPSKPPMPRTTPPQKTQKIQEPRIDHPCGLWLSLWPRAVNGYNRLTYAFLWTPPSPGRRVSPCRRGNRRGPGQAAGQAADPEKLPSISDKVAGLQKIDGYMPLYWQASTGKLFMEVGRFNQEMLYQVSLPAGLGSNPVGLDRGQLGDSSVIAFEHIGPKVLMMQPNYHYRAISSNDAERRAVEDSFARSVLWGFKVEAEDGAARARRRDRAFSCATRTA